MNRALRQRHQTGVTKLTHLADEELMHLMQRGESPAFELIYDRHVGAAYSLAYRMCGAPVAAEDVVQEAFLSIWRSAARYDRMRGSVRTWILGIVHNRAIDQLRRSVVHDRRRASDEACSVLRSALSRGACASASRSCATTSERQWGRAHELPRR